MGNRYWVRLLLDESVRLEREGHLGGASAQVEEAAKAWPAKREQDLAAEIAQRRRALEAATSRYREARAEVTRAIADRRFYGARAHLQHVRSLGAPEDPAVDVDASTVERAIAEVERMLRTARESRLSGEDAARVYQQAIQYCADCAEARTLLASTPPSAPRALAASVRGSVVSLSWQASASAATAYIVVRKERIQPAVVSDGARLATVTGLQFEDERPPAGLPLYYAVYADREGVTSRDAARLASPVLITQGVGDLVVRVDDGQVHLRWTSPPNVERVFAVRSRDRGVTNPVQGVRLESPDGQQVVDRGLVNETTYWYTVFCEYHDQYGALLLSPGTTVSATPQVPPRAIDELEFTNCVTAGGRGVRISWSAPAKGDVHVVKTPDPTNLAGHVIPASGLKSLGQVLAGGGAQVVDSWPSVGFCYYTAAVVFGGMAYMGRAHRYVCVEDVAGLAAQNLGSALRLKWQWPSGCAEAQICYSADNWPDDPKRGEAGVTALKVSRQEYDRNGCYDLRQPQQQDYFVVVQAIVRRDGQQIVAAGASAGARVRVRLASKVRLEYEVHRPLFGKARLRLRTDKQAALPTLLLLRKHNALPLNRGDGECVLRLAGPVEVERERSIDLASVAGGNRSYVKLFLEDDAAYAAVDVLHPSLAKLTL